MAEVRGPGDLAGSAGQSMPFMVFLLMKRLQKKRWIEQYAGEYPISIKRSRSDFIAKYRLDDPHSNLKFADVAP